MSFIPFIRDYVELLNTIYDSLSTDISIPKIIQETILYFGQTIKFIVFYVITFQWIRDLIYLPIIIPQISNSILKETFFLQTPLENTFNFFEIPTYHTNKFLIGFLNSFFLALPISCAHFIYLRRFLIQGYAAGIAAGLGNIIGQLFFIGATILGFRGIFVSWFFLDPLPYIIGLILLLTIIYDMVHERVIKIIDWNNIPALSKIFFLNFFLIWTEQSCIFQYLGNVNLTADSSILESFSTNSFFEYFSFHLLYLLGLFFGNIFFTIIFAFCIQKSTEYIQTKFGILRSTWIIKLNASLLIFTLAFTFTSIPFYGIDYLLTKPLGFISEDKAFKKTIFSSNEVTDPFGLLGGFSENLSVDTDITSFDRGLYLKSPSFQSFEDLNYSGEYATTIRQGNIPLFDQYKEKARKFREILVKKSEVENVSDQNSGKTNLISNKTKISQLDYSPNIDKQFKTTEYPTYYPIDTDVFISTNIQKRFENTYKEPSNTIFENILQGSLNSVFSDEKYSTTPELEKTLRQKYYANPVYKFLINADIDSFLKRQPREYLLSSNEENDLFKKRLILGRYNDSLRFYNTIPYTDEFQYFFNGSKSFADRVYNQQFKGTLHIVRRLFSISVDSKQPNEQELIFKYDQPLFSKNTRKNIPSISHEELTEYSGINFSSKSPLLEIVSQSPLYIGWDEDLRKILLTNRLLSKSITNFTETESLSKPVNSSDTNIKFRTIEFTTWPISKNVFENSNSKTMLTSRTLYETRSRLENLNYSNLIPFFEYDDIEGGLSSYDSLPNNIIRLASGSIDVIPPNRGGFIWPGTSSLKFSIKDIFSKG